MLIYSWMLIAPMSLCLSGRTNTRKKWERTRRWRRKPAGRWVEPGQKRERAGLGGFFFCWFFFSWGKQSSAVKERNKKRTQKQPRTNLCCTDSEQAVQSLASCIDVEIPKRKSCSFFYKGKWVGGGAGGEKTNRKFLKGATMVVWGEWTRQKEVNI